MINTGLPYDIKQMSMIAQEGAIVDMNNINFPGIDESNQVRTAFIFMRNTGFNVKLDWSNCTDERQYSILKEYITSDIKWHSDDMCDMWCEMLNDYITGLDTYCAWQGKADGLIDETMSLLASLPIYIMYRHELNGTVFNLDDIEKKESSKIGANYISLLKNSGVDDLIIFACGAPKIQPKFWTELFTDDNNDLMSALFESKSGICQIMHAFTTEEPTKFREDMEQIDNAYETIIHNEEWNIGKD